MPKSQLKQLKASLHEKGIIGQPQKSKKTKTSRNAADQDQRARRYAALQGIRDSFNPFELQAAPRSKKFVATTARDMGGNAGKGPLSRPGVTRSLGEESVWFPIALISRECTLTDSCTEEAHFVT